MLTRLRIVNIQKHKDLDLTLDKLNVIVGATDSGKTSVLRALTWALTNDASGENLITNDGSKSCSVTVTTDEGTVTRSWSRSKNAYELDDKVFTTFRSGVPKPIEDVINIKDINIQRRRDLPFMVYYKDSECASQFSDMMDLSEIDTIITSSNSAVKQYALKTEQLKNDKSALDSEIASLNGLDDALGEFSNLRALQRAIRELEGNLQDLKLLYRQYTEAKRQFDSLIDPSKAVSDIEVLLDMQHKVAKQGVLLKKYSNLRHAWNHAKECLDMYKDVDTMCKGFKGLECKAGDIQSIKYKTDAYANALMQYRMSKVRVGSTKSDYDEALESFKMNFPKLCPLCGKAACDD